MHSIADKVIFNKTFFQFYQLIFSNKIIFYNILNKIHGVLLYKGLVSELNKLYRYKRSLIMATICILKLC